MYTLDARVYVYVFHQEIETAVARAPFLNGEMLFEEIVRISKQIYISRWIPLFYLFIPGVWILERARAREQPRVAPRQSFSVSLSLSRSFLFEFEAAK